MELRHLRYFIVVAEELHFGRAAHRLHIETSPLSRAIKELESELEVQLFDRDTRKTRITGPGALFLDEARRVLATLEQACKRVRAAAQGIFGILRIGYSDGLALPVLADVIARFRQDEPGIDVRVAEMSFADQARMLRQGLLDVGLSFMAVVGEEIVTVPLWRDPVVAVLPAKHPFTRRKSIALTDTRDQPLVLCHPSCGSGCFSQIDHMLRSAVAEPQIAEYAITAAAGVTLVAAGYGIGFMGASEAAMFQRPDIVIRPLSGKMAALTTYLMVTKKEPAGAAKRFIDRLRSAR